jgi:hypothetical protein
MGLGVDDRILVFRLAKTDIQLLLRKPQRSTSKAASQSSSNEKSLLGSVIICGKSELNRFRIKLVHPSHRNANQEFAMV